MDKVRFQDTITDERIFDNGTLQGSSLSPSIFNYAMNVFLRLQLPEGVRIMSYADDLMVNCVHRKNIISRIQDALNQLSTTGAASGSSLHQREDMGNMVLWSATYNQIPHMQQRYRMGQQ